MTSLNKTWFYVLLLYFRIPGQLNDRRTPLGELNWIFTAVTDTIAWNTLPRGMFERLWGLRCILRSTHEQPGTAKVVVIFFEFDLIKVLLTKPIITHPHSWHVESIRSFHCLSDLFQKLFRTDSMVASLFRHFLLAERVMRSYNCTPVTCPKLPSMYHHPMW